MSYNGEWIEFFNKIILPALVTTFRMVFFTMLFSAIFGFILAVLLIWTSEGGLRPNKLIYKFLDFVVNMTRSLPILILIVAVMPLTKVIVGTTIGETAAILPMTFATTAFVGRSLENIFKGVNPQLIEAAKAFGATDFQIIMKVIVRESIPSIISIATMATITTIANSTIAGTVGGGGLGAIAINYGYQSFNDSVLYTTVIILYLLVQLVQFVGSNMYKKSL